MNNLGMPLLIGFLLLTFSFVLAAPNIRSATYVQKDANLFGTLHKYAIFEVNLDSELYFLDQSACPCVNTPTDVCVANTTTDNTVWPEYGLNVTTLQENEWVTRESTTDSHFKFVLHHNASRPCPILSIEVEPIEGFPVPYITVNKGIATTSNAQWTKTAGNYPATWICGQHPEFAYGTYYINVRPGTASVFTIFRIRYRVFSAATCPASTPPPPYPDDGSFKWLTEGKAETDVATYTDYRKFKFYVPQKCATLTVAVYRTTTVGDIDVYISTTQELPTLTSNMWKGNTDNDDHVAIAYCNETGNELIFHIGVTTVSPTDTPFMIVASTAVIVPPRAIHTLAPAMFTQFFSFGQFQLTCPSQIFKCEWFVYDACYEDAYDCCHLFWPLAPTDNPQPFLPWNIAYNYPTMLNIPWREHPSLRRGRLAFVLWLASATEEEYIPRVYNSIPDELSSCKLKINNQLMDANGEALNFEPISFTPKNVQCNAQQFRSLASSIRNVISTMNNVTDYNELRAAHVKLNTIAFNDVMPACRKAVVELPTGVQAIPIEYQYDDVSACLKTPGSPEFSNDPCCNVSLLNLQCCATSSAVVSAGIVPPQTLPTAENSALFGACSSHGCARVRYEDFSSSMREVLAQQTGCSATFARSGGDERRAELSSFIARCRDSIVGHDLNGVYCTSDNDCLTTCNKTTNRCNHDESLVLECFAENIDPLIARLLMNEWGYSGRFTKEELVDAFEENIMANLCTGFDSIHYRPHYSFEPILPGCVDSCSGLEPVGFTRDLELPPCNIFSFSTCYREWSFIEPVAQACEDNAYECNWMDCNELGLTGADCQAACTDPGLSAEVCVDCSSGRCLAIEEFDKDRCQEGLCLVNSSIATAAECLNSGECSISCPNCDTQAGCEAAGVCTDTLLFQPLMDQYNYTNVNGVCVQLFQWSKSGSPYCEDEDAFTPLGCFDPTNSDKASCESADGFWIDLVTSDSEFDRCSKSRVACFDEDLQIYRMDASESECAQTCQNSAMRPIATWQQGVWKAGTVQQLAWVQRSYIKVRSVAPTIDYLAFQDKIDTIIGTLSSYAFVTEALCRYDKSNELIISLLCDCGIGGERGQNCYTNTLSSSQIAAGLGCPFVSGDISTSSAYLYIYDDTFTDSSCHSIQLHQILATQFKRETGQQSLSSALFQTDPEKNAFSIVENENGIIVGQLVSNGIEIVVDSVDFVNKAYLCINRESAIVENEAFGTYYIGKLDPDTLVITVSSNYAANITVSQTQVCGEIFKRGTYFAVKLLNDWETTDTSEETLQRRYSIAGAVLYFVGAVFAVIQLIMTVVTGARTPEGHFKPQTKDKLGIISIVLVFELVRGVYLILDPSIWEKEPLANYIVFEVPTLLFFFVYTAIIYLWVSVVVAVAKMGNRKSLRQLRVAYTIFNALMVLMFAIFILAFSLAPTPDSESELANCSLGTLVVTRSLSKSQYGIRLAYNVVIAAICLLLSLAFLVSGILLVKPLLRSRKTSKKKADFQLFLISSLAVWCTIFFLVRSAVFLYSIITGAAVPVLVFVLIELLPTLGLLYYARPFKRNPFSSGVAFPRMSAVSRTEREVPTAQVTVSRELSIRE